MPDLPTETWALVYTGGRTLAAVVIGVSGTRGGAPVWRTVGQGASDVACVLFLLAYLDYDLRDVAKFFAPLLLVYVLLWEAWSLRARLGAEDDADAGDGTALIWPLQFVYEVLMIMPPVAAGAFLVFDLIFPRQWPFPNRPPALRCEPGVVARGDRLTLRLDVPHGGELGVFTPSGRFLYVDVVELTPGGTPRGLRFEQRERLTLSSGTAAGRARPGGAVERVFSDTGTYMFRVSEAAEVSASLICRVRYVGPPRSGTPPGPRPRR